MLLYVNLQISDIVQHISLFRQTHMVRHPTFSRNPFSLLFYFEVNIFDRFFNFKFCLLVGVTPNTLGH